MLSEKQYFEAKSFLYLYKDTFDCIEQVARKRTQLNSQIEFYKRLKEGHVKNQITINSVGSLEEAENIKEAYFYKLFELAESRVADKLNLYKKYTYQGLSEFTDSIIADLESEIDLLRSNKSK